MLKPVFFILLLGFLSCKSQKHEQVEKPENDLVLLTQDGYSAIENFDTMVVRDQKTLNSFYSKINKTRKPGLPVPIIDFSKEMVLIVCMGEQVGVDLPDLIKKEEDDKEITLQINPLNSKEEAPSNLISSPFCVYKMPITEKEVVFIKM